MTKRKGPLTVRIMVQSGGLSRRGEMQALKKNQEAVPSQTARHVLDRQQIPRGGKGERKVEKNPGKAKKTTIIGQEGREFRVDIGSIKSRHNEEKD